MAAATWTVDRSRSAVNFAARHMVVTKVKGTFTRWTATASIDEADLTKSSVEAHIETASVDTREPTRDEYLKSADFFDVARYPSMVFQSKKIEKTAGNRYKVVGDLKIRDVTREVTLHTEYGGTTADRTGGARAAFTAESSIERKDFGLTWNVALDVLVGEKIAIAIEFAVVKGV